MKSVFLLKFLPASTAIAEVALYWQTRFLSLAVLRVIPAFSLNPAHAQVISLTNVNVSGCYLDPIGTESPAIIPFLNLAAIPFNMPMSSTFTRGSHVNANRNLSAAKANTLSTNGTIVSGPRQNPLAFPLVGEGGLGNLAMSVRVKRPSSPCSNSGPEALNNGWSVGATTPLIFLI